MIDDVCCVCHCFHWQTIHAHFYIDGLPTSTPCASTGAVCSGTTTGIRLPQSVPANYVNNAPGFNMQKCGAQGLSPAITNVSSSRVAAFVSDAIQARIVVSVAHAPPAANISYASVVGNGV
jgi:hypothetical protein